MYSIDTISKHPFRKSRLLLWLFMVKDSKKLTFALYLISTSEINIVETKNVLQHDVRPILNFRPVTFARLQALSSNAHLCTILEDIRRK